MVDRKLLESTATISTGIELACMKTDMTLSNSEEEAVMFRRAIIRRPGKDFPSCISTHEDSGTIDYNLAIDQHKAYEELFREIGLEVITLPPLEGHPDACFVEDTVVVDNKKAVITNPRMKERRGEVDTIAQVLIDYLDLYRLSGDEFLEGGDVIHTEDKLIVGLTSRTNRLGIEKLDQLVEKKVEVVEDKSMMHLKSHVTYLGKDWMIGERRVLENGVFDEFVKIVIDKAQAYASNTLTVNDVIIMPKGFDRAVSAVREQGFEVTVLDTSQFRLCDGALTCLSVLF